MNIAVIDDNECDAVIYSKTFLSQGCFDYFKCISDFAKTKNSYDVVVLDLNLPDGFGVDAIKSVKELTSAKIIIVTGTAANFLNGKLMHSLIEAGASNVFEKDKLLSPHYCNFIKEAVHEL